VNNRNRPAVQPAKPHGRGSGAVRDRRQQRRHLAPAL